MVGLLAPLVHIIHLQVISWHADDTSRVISLANDRLSIIQGDGTFSLADRPIGRMNEDSATA